MARFRSGRRVLPGLSARPPPAQPLNVKDHIRSDGWSLAVRALMVSCRTTRRSCVGGVVKVNQTGTSATGFDRPVLHLCIRRHAVVQQGVEPALFSTNVANGSDCNSRIVSATTALPAVRTQAPDAERSRGSNDRRKKTVCVPTGSADTVASCPDRNPLRVSTLWLVSSLLPYSLKHALAQVPPPHASVYHFYFQEGDEYDEMR